MSHALVSLVDGIPCTTSLLVAETFGKRHDHVLRDIDKIKSQTPESFSQPNFGAANYTDAQGKTRLMYLLTRDGLTLLVMGYTGKEALRFKLAYIEAFNCMEKQLEALRAAPEPLLLSTVDDRRKLNSLVREWAALSGQSFPDCWAEIHVAFDISAVADLPAARVTDAEDYVRARIREYTKPALPEPDFPMELAEYNGKNFWKDLEDIIKRITVINSALALNVRTGCLMKHEFYADTINNQVGIAQGSLVLARAALGDALRLKGRRDVWK